MSLSSLSEAADASWALADSKALVQRAALRMSRDLVQVIGRRSDVLPPGDAARVRLEAQATRVLEKVSVLRDTATARAAQTRAIGKELAARKSDAETRLAAAQSLSAVADGKPVPAAEAARLLSALVPRQPDKTPERRAGSR